MNRYNILLSLIIFEFKSWIGRKFMKSRSKIPISKSPVLLDLGVGANYTDNWIHADFYRISNPIKKILRRKNKIKIPEVQLDLRYPLNCPDNSVDGVYSSHTLEHLPFDDAVHLLKEIYRVLKTSKWLRISVPDLEIVVNFYIGKNKNLPFESGCEAIGYLTQNCGHKSVWDETFLTKILVEVGFVNIKKVEYGIEGHDERLIKETPSRKSQSLVIEAQKAL